MSNIVNLCFINSLLSPRRLQIIIFFKILNTVNHHTSIHGSWSHKTEQPLFSVINHVCIDALWHVSVWADRCCSLCVMRGAVTYIM